MTAIAGLTGALREPEGRNAGMRPEVPGLDLPPLYREVRLREAGDAFAHARAIAAEAGAGTLVWSRSPRLFDVAVVLEPAMPLGRARSALYVGMSSLADALALHAPPENPISFVWPDLIEVNGGAVGGVRLAWDEVGELRAPAWMVLHAGLRLVLDDGALGARDRHRVVGRARVQHQDLPADRGHRPQATGDPRGLVEGDHYAGDGGGGRHRNRPLISRKYRS